MRHEISLLEVKTSQLEAENASLRRKNIDFEARDRDASHLQHVVASLEREIQTLASENNHLRQTISMEVRSHHEPYVRPKYELPQRPAPTHHSLPSTGESRRFSRDTECFDSHAHSAPRRSAPAYHTPEHTTAPHNNVERRTTERTHSAPPVRAPNGTLYCHSVVYIIYVHRYINKPTC